MKSDESISIILSPVQIEQVVRSAKQSSPDMLSQLLRAALATDAPADNATDQHSSRLGNASQQALSTAANDPQLSQSLLRGLSILSSFGPDRPWRPITDLARQIGLSSSTTHRYVKTLRAVGLLEQDPTTREYRPAVATVTGTSG